jgi:hypothetical protein
MKENVKGMLIKKGKSAIGKYSKGTRNSKEEK